MRECGGCVVCCYVAEIVELKKPANVLCRYAKLGEGCGVYKDRPGSCKKFSCSWLNGELVNEELRPDKCGVMFEKLPGKETYVAFVDGSNPNAWKAELVQKEMQLMLQFGQSVIIKIGNGNEPNQWIALVPEGRTADEVIGEFAAAVQERNRWQAPATPQT